MVDPSYLLRSAKALPYFEFGWHVLRLLEQGKWSNCLRSFPRIWKLHVMSYIFYTYARRDEQEAPTRPFFPASAIIVFVHYYCSTTS